MPEIPHDNRWDSALDFNRDPYRFISNRCRELSSDLFQTRVLLHKGICVTGPALAELFYDEQRFKRRGVAPRRFQKTLFGKGGVQGMDGESHKHRKQMFLSLVTPPQIQKIGQISALWWARYGEFWSREPEVELYDQLCEMLTRVACEWAEVPLAESEVVTRSRELTAMFDYAGSIGPKHWWARIARRRAERWIETLVEQVRTRRLSIAEDSTLFVIAWHRNLDGQLLSPNVAAVEILNVLRPIVAVAVYLTLAAHALEAYPAARDLLINGPADYSHLFAEEVRRFYPFFPAVGAEIRHDFEWNGYCFPKGVPVLLDLYGTNHDERIWESPFEFRPERFRDFGVSAFGFIPQGGGDARTTHRCPGESIAVELLRVAAEFLTRSAEYTVPDQDLTLDFTRVPALPHSKIVMRDFRLSV